MNEIIDRERELGELRELAQTGDPSLGLLYGRRRVGKTYLLRRAWKQENFFYFLAADETLPQNRQELLHELNLNFNQNIQPRDYPNWRTVFRLFLRLAEEKPLVIVLDEFQYLISKKKEENLPSQLAAVWEEAEGIDITLLLCGSEISMMRSLKEGKGTPLYGRFNWAQRLQPFTYREAGLMLPKRNFREIIKTYAIYGGMPQYLDSISENEELKKHVCKNILSRRGEVHLQINSLFEQEKGIHDPGAYHAILSAIAAGNRTVNEIATVSGVQGKNNTITRDKLTRLMDLFLVDREKNCDAKKGPYRYYILDHGVRFWYKYVLPNRSRIELGYEEEVWDHQVAPSLNTYIGHVFEHVCRESFVHYHQNWELSIYDSWGRWEGQDRNRKDIEIDIVARLVSGLRLTGEIKWSSSSVDVGLYYEHKNNLEALSSSGRKWAHQALKEGGQIYFSAAGFSKQFQELAKDKHITLIDLEKMFPESEQKNE